LVQSISGRRAKIQYIFFEKITPLLLWKNVKEREIIPTPSRIHEESLGGVGINFFIP
jgi:hypothetical protein